mmetsp:Transcript_4397/g.6196  ORF Transcript_4397/g.6196 Transcript_4397/m.6196 type:complete len:199 (+) Transcript_4397:100-696(+)
MKLQKELNYLTKIPDMSSAAHKVPEEEEKSTPQGQTTPTNIPPTTNAPGSSNTPNIRNAPNPANPALAPTSTSTTQNYSTSQSSTSQAPSITAPSSNKPPNQLSQPNVTPVPEQPMPQGINAQQQAYYLNPTQPIYPPFAMGPPPIPTNPYNMGSSQPPPFQGQLYSYNPYMMPAFPSSDCTKEMMSSFKAIDKLKGT